MNKEDEGLDPLQDRRFNAKYAIEDGHVKANGDLECSVYKSFVSLVKDSDLDVDSKTPGLQPGEPVNLEGLRTWNDVKSCRKTDLNGRGWIAQNPRSSRTKWFNVAKWGSWRLAYFLARLQCDIWNLISDDPVGDAPTASSPSRDRFTSIDERGRSGRLLTKSELQPAGSALEANIDLESCPDDVPGGASILHSKRRPKGRPKGSRNKVKLVAGQGSETLSAEQNAEQNMTSVLDPVEQGCETLSREPSAERNVTSVLDPAGVSEEERLFGIMEVSSAESASEKASSEDSSSQSEVEHEVESPSETAPQVAVEQEVESSSMNQEIIELLDEEAISHFVHFLNQIEAKQKKEEETLKPHGREKLLEQTRTATSSKDASAGQSKRKFNERERESKRKTKDRQTDAKKVLKKAKAAETKAKQAANKDKEPRCTCGCPIHTDQCRMFKASYIANQRWRFVDFSRPTPLSSASNQPESSRSTLPPQRPPGLGRPMPPPAEGSNSRAPNQANSNPPTSPPAGGFSSSSSQLSSDWARKEVASIMRELQNVPMSQKRAALKRRLLLYHPDKQHVGGATRNSNACREVCEEILRIIKAPNCSSMDGSGEAVSSRR